MAYTTTLASKAFGKSKETIRAWAEEFEKELSVTANPGNRRTRMLNEDDMRVLAWVAKRKDEGATFPDIHAELQNGQRGDPPALSSEDMQSLVLGDQERELSLRLEVATQQLAQARRDLAESLKHRAEALAYKQLYEHSVKQVTSLEERLKEAQDKIADLSQQVGSSKSESYIEGYERGLDRQLPHRPDQTPPA